MALSPLFVVMVGMENPTNVNREWVIDVDGAMGSTVKGEMDRKQKGLAQVFKCMKNSRQN